MYIGYCNCVTLGVYHHIITLTYQSTCYVRKYNMHTLSEVDVINNLQLLCIKSGRLPYKLYNNLDKRMIRGSAH